MTKYNFKFLLCLIVAVLSKTATAASLVLASQPDFVQLCPDQLKAFENIQVQQSLTSDGKECFLSIHPRDAYETLIYRDYLISSDGLLMVFNSYSAELSSTSDGAREFYFLPNEFKGFDWKVENQDLVITGFMNRVLKFSLKTAQLQALSGAEIKISDKVAPNNKGGLEIISADFLYIDAGFKLGDSPSNDRSRSSTVKNPQKQICMAPNPKIYRYPSGDVELKPITELSQVIKAICPGFNFSADHDASHEFVDPLLK